MNPFKKLSEFESEFLKLSKKYRSLAEDIKKFECFVLLNPTGLGKNFTIIHSGEDFKIVKARMKCTSLKSRSIRIIYAYHKNTLTFMHIEIYFKGDKENEDRERVSKYIKNIS